MDIYESKIEINHLLFAEVILVNFDVDVSRMSLSH